MLGTVEVIIPVLVLFTPILFLLSGLLRRFRSAGIRRDHPLPPGPTPLPLVGNLFDLPKPGEYEWLHWAKHKELYGPLSSVAVFGKPLIIVNDPKVALELLDTRSAIYSDRPVCTFAGEMCGWKDALSLVHYDDRFRAQRRLIHRFMGTSKLIESFHGLFLSDTHRLLQLLLDDPEKHVAHFRTMAGGITLSMVYGYSVHRDGLDPLIGLAEAAVEAFTDAATQGKWLVDTFPLLQHLPGWLPGAGFKRVATNYKHITREFAEMPFMFVKLQMREGRAKPSFTANYLEKCDLTKDEESDIRNSAMSLYAGGADTVVSALHSFILAILLYPHVQARAQAEIDCVVGNERLPTFEDRVNLPYVNAIVSETHRWNPILPMGLPHVAAKDDVYMGYTIPKGAPVLTNVWLFTHDPAVYHDPMTFKPERFLTGSEPSLSGHAIPERDPRDFIFGFGRRICAGRLLADSLLFISVARILAAFDIRRPDRENAGERVYTYTSGLLSHPKAFDCTIIPRSKKAAELIMVVEDEDMNAEPSDVEKLLSMQL